MGKNYPGAIRPTKALSKTYDYKEMDTNDR